MTDPIARLNAALEGRYRIERELGEGGMATVYLADDLKHERKVALKVLKPEVAAVVGAERFLAEIKTTANLQHPHILPLFDSGEADSVLFYVMPYVEGETLRDRIDREHQLPVDDAVRIAANVAEALDYAHSQGVIHRDIKPANILLQAGKPVISDFGIALAVGAAGGDRLTETGLSLGTPHYMSPEQATGDLSVGPPTDIYALGCVLYEMLVGEPPYVGSTAQAILGKIIAGQVVAARDQRKSIPLHVDATVLKALERVAADRFDGGLEFVRALNDRGFRHGSALGSGGGAANLWKRVAIGLGAGVTLLVAALLIQLVQNESPGPVERISVFLGEGQDLRHFRSFDLSADGSTLVYQGPSLDGAAFNLWVRRWDELEPRHLDGGDGLRPAISPDGASVAFMRGTVGSSAIGVLPLAGGLERTLVPSDVRCCDITWSLDGEWLYFTIDEGLARIPALGGEIEIIAPAPDESRLAELDILPGGRTGVLIRYQDRFSDPWVMTVDLRSGETRDLVPGLRPRFRDGYLFFADRTTRTLMAAPFDADAMELTGSPVSVVENLTGGRYAHPYYTLSRTGTLLYATGGDLRSDVVVVDRVGRIQAVDPDWTMGGNGAWWRIELSPDDSRVAVSSMRPERTIDQNESDVYLHTFGIGRQRITVSGRRNYVTGWFSADSLTFTRLEVDQTSATFDVRKGRADSPGESEVVLDPVAMGLDVTELVEGFYAPGGDWFVFTLAGDLHASRVEDGGLAPSRAIVATEANEASPALSSDGRWLAYQSDVSGQTEVYVRAFPDGAGSTLVSSGGGSWPVWRQDGRELYYASSDGSLVAVEIQAEAGFSTGDHAELFPATGGLRLGSETRRYYDATRDGERFLVVRTVSTGPMQIIRVENFLSDVARLFAN